MIPANMSTLDFDNIWTTSEDRKPILVTSEHNGDVNLDGVCDSLDLVNLKKQLLGSGTAYSSDINRDGLVNILDLISLKKY